MSWVRPDKLRQETFGLGTKVVATAPLRQREVIGVFSGEFRAFEVKSGKVDWQEADFHYILDLYCDGSRLLGLVLPDRECALNQINHSCTPNCELAGNHSLTLVTRRAIRPGEELTFDYRPITIFPIGLPCWCSDVAEDKRCRL